MKRFFAIALFAVAVSAPAFAQAPIEERRVDAAKVFAMLDKFYAAPPAERSMLAMRYTITEDGKPPTHVRLTLVEGARRTPLPIRTDGKVERIPTAAELAGHAEVLVEAPKGSRLATRPDVDTTIRPGLEISAADCARAIDQFNAQVRRVAGVMAMVAPKAKACTFPGSGSGVAVMVDGKTQPLPLMRGAPALEPDALKGARSVRLANPPTMVSLE
jgi:hypothetical protein